MNSKKMLSLYGLKWNPFSQELPSEALIRSTQFDQFCWRVENLALEGGFALITGPSGLGKSVSLRLLSEHLAKIRDVTVGALSRPQSGVGDFYRELGYLFGVELRASNRWGGYKTLREKWQTHIESTLLRPILLIDEAQQMLPAVLSELRLLTSHAFDSQLLLTVVLAGDDRFLQMLRTTDLIPLGTRIRSRMNLDMYTKQDLLNLLRESTKRAGNAKLMTDELVETLVDHSAGNPRILMTLAAEILALAIKKELTQLDEGLYLEAYPPSPKVPGRKMKS
jgi:type II secretory pathway predicted ATPase ExeA